MLLKIPFNLFHEDQHLKGHSDNVHLIFPHRKPEVAMYLPGESLNVLKWGINLYKVIINLLVISDH